MDKKTSYEMPISQRLLDFACSVGISDTETVSFTNRFVVKPIQWLGGQEEITGFCVFISKHLIARIIGATTSVFAAMTLAYHATITILKVPVALLYSSGLVHLSKDHSFKHLMYHIENIYQSALLVLFGSIIGVCSPSFVTKIGFPLSERNNIPIFGYHKIDAVIKDPWTISPTLFLHHLQILHKNHYELCTFKEFCEGYTPASGKKLAIITFDDGDETQFKIVKNNDGTIAIDPSSAVGIMMGFQQQHPDFRCTATFFINTSKEAGSSGNTTHYLFSSDDTQESLIIHKLSYLVQHGFEIAAHGHLHQRFDRLTKEEIEADIVLFDEEIDNLKEHANGSLDALEIVSFAWPHGIMPNKKKRAAIDARFNYIADYGLHAGKVNPTHIDNTSIPRLFIGPNTCFSQYVPAVSKQAIHSPT